MKTFFLSLLLTLVFAGSAFAQATPDWTNPFPPYRIIGNVYYVGSQGLASYLITTKEGHILINSSLESSVPLIRESIEKLGFKFGDVKILLISHAHWDHCAGSASIKELTGAKYMVMDADVPEIEAGGKGNFQYGDSPTSRYQPTKVDRVLHDGEWTMKAKEGDRTYNVVIIGSPNVNAGYKLVNNALYPQIASDYERMFRVLKSLPCDVFLGAHGNYYGMEAKYARMKEHAANPFIDPEGYKSYVAEREQTFRTELAKQTAAAK